MVGQLWIRETMSRTLELRLRRFEVTGLPHSHVTVLLSRKALQLLFMRLALPYSKSSVAWNNALALHGADTHDGGQSK